MQKCGARTGCLIKEVWQQMWLPGRGSKGVVQETASWKKGVAADVAPPEEDAKVWRKNWLLWF
jgi:hypothetical protein